VMFFKTKSVTLQNINSNIMGTTTIGENTSLGMYWNIIKNLSPETKLDLIGKLSASLMKHTKPATVSLDSKSHGAWAANLAGRWQDDRATEDIVSDIREARTANREIEL